MNKERDDVVSLKFLDLFSGVGGFHLGMAKAGHDCVGYVEWDKFARKSYEAMYDVSELWTRKDITKVTDEEWSELHGTVDVICGGFPCQAFSIAGHRRGFEDTRGTLFFEIARAAKIIKPSFLFLENVRGILSHEQGSTMRTILATLHELDYDVSMGVLNSKNFGVPQNRERVFIVARRHSGNGSRREIFPIGKSIKKADALQRQQSVANTITTRSQLAGADGTYVIECEQSKNRPKQVMQIYGTEVEPNPQAERVYSPAGISPTLDTCQGENRMPKVAIPVLTPERAEKRQNGRRFKEDGEPMFTLTSQDRHGVAIKEATKQGYTIAEVGDSINLAVPNSKTRRGRVGNPIANTLETSCNQATLTDDFRIRKLTPLECFRLQGFPDELFYKAQAVNSDSQLYKQAGNSVTVNVIYEIAKKLELEVT